MRRCRYKAKVPEMSPLECPDSDGRLMEHDCDDDKPTNKKTQSTRKSNKPGIRSGTTKNTETRLRDFLKFKLMNMNHAYFEMFSCLCRL